MTSSALLIEPHRIEIVDRALPPVGGEEARIRVLECGLCTSELDAWSGRADGRLPLVLGHEVAGVVAEVGGAVSAVSVGDHVAAWVQGGGFAEETLVHERFCVPVAPGTPYPAVAEPLGCVVSAVELTAPALGDDVVVIGAGFMGNLLQMASRLKAPRSVTVADIRADARRRAGELGATRVVDPLAESLAEVIAHATEGRGADVAYEATGVQAGLDLASDVVRMGGKLCIAGYHLGGTRTVDLGAWNWKALRIINAHFRDPGTIVAGMRAGLRLVTCGALDAAALVTHRYPLRAISEAFETAASRPEGFVKAVVEIASAG